MRIIYMEVDGHLEKQLAPSVCTVGFFDGLHKGHQALISKAVSIAKESGMAASMITFSPSPKAFLTKTPEQLLTTVSERAKVAKDLGIEQFIVLKFNKELSSLSPDQFHELFINSLNIKHVVCGEDFRYGHKGAGSVITLQKDPRIKVSVINDVIEDDERISSTLIKEGLTNGDIDMVTKALNKPYSIDGFVKHGRKVGRTIGFPTVNLSYPYNKILIKDGVYTGITTVKGKHYISTINVGHNPTVNHMSKKSIESFIHHFDEDIYNEAVTFKFVKRLRDEQKFDSVEALIEQMHRDIANSEAYFSPDVRKEYDIEAL